MPELSNLLRQRLGAAQTGNLEHPEADVLAAFSEQLLLAPERQEVVAHLAVCPDCREIVALSQTQAPELTPQIVLKPTPASGWRKVFRPAFGLAGLVAAMAVVAVVILQIQQKPIQPN